MWWIYALLSALFAALTAIFAKIGIKGVDTNLADDTITDRFYFRVDRFSITVDHLLRAVGQTEMSVR